MVDAYVATAFRYTWHKGSSRKLCCNGGALWRVPDRVFDSQGKLVSSWAAGEQRLMLR